jgi:hypothetical protein
MDRRDFLKGLAVTGMLASVPAHSDTSPSDIDPRVTKINAFDYDGVRLRDSRWNDQYLHAREFYFNVSNDDILQGFRAKAGLPATRQCVIRLRIFWASFPRPSALTAIAE